ncbi:VgrG-related protein [Streptomyces klenkii]|uniref:VgrG-related protein n=1 Tax=Streptomyces klenkii TaxID=1420899 RepID=UPI0034441F3B
MPRPHSAGLLVLVDGQPLPETWGQALTWAFVTEARHTPAACEVGFRDPSCLLPQRSGLRLGALVELRASEGSGSSELFSGEVTGCEVVAGESGTFSVVHAHDLAHRLRRGRRVKGYRQMSVGDIAAKIADTAGLKKGQIDTTSIVYEYVSQNGESDWDFMTRLARENGCDVFVQAGRLHLRSIADAGTAPAPPARAAQSPYVLEYGENLLKVRSAARVDEQVRSVRVRGWDADSGQPIVAESTVSATPSRDTAWKPGADVVRGEPLTLSSIPRADQHEAEVVAAAMAQEVAADLTTLNAVVTGAPQLKVRSAVTITGLSDRFDGRYTATRIRHEFHPDSGYLTDLTVQEGDALLPSVGRPGDAEASAPRLPGVVCATVKSIKDPLKQGRVKLVFPWLAGEKDYESDWARTVQLSGTKGGGIVCPEEGEEVLAAFEQGCLGRPYVIGGLFSKRRTPGRHTTGELYDETKGHTNVRSFVSRTGQRLELLDEEGGRMGALLASGDGKLRIDLDQSQTSITVKSDGEVLIDAKNKISIESRQISLTARGGPLNLSGQTVSVHADTNVSLEGNGICSIKGSMIKLN